MFLKFVYLFLKMPAKNVQSWNTALDAFIEALSLENKVNNKLYHLHDKAAEAKDQHVSLSLLNYFDKS